jgi:hypothetical protein
VPHTLGRYLRRHPRAYGAWLIETKQGGTTVALEVREAVDVGFKVGMIMKLRGSLDQLAEEVMLAVLGM